MKVLVVQTRWEQMKVLQRDEEIIFERVIINEPNQVIYVEGLKIKEVFVTPEVLTSGLNARLFDQLYGTLVSMSVDPLSTFHLFEIRREA